MRFGALLACALVALLATGCSAGVNKDLRALVAEAGLPPTDTLGCELGSSDSEGEPDSWYGCWDYVRGDLRHVSRAMRAHLTDGGFTVSSRRGPDATYLTATRGSDTLCVDVLARSFVSARNTAPAEVNITHGEVFVDAWTYEGAGSAGGAHCEALPVFTSA